MDGFRHLDAMNDPSLDREIESLLATDPSPEFVARVRTRVAKEPGPTGWRASWVFAVAGGAVAVVIVAVIAWPSRELAPAGPTGPALQAQRQPSLAGASETPAPSQPIRQRPAIARVVAVSASPDRPIDIDLPDVVIAENEVKAYTTLVSSIRRSRFDVAVPAAPDPNTPLEVKELPPIEPLEIEPIVKLATLE